MKIIVFFELIELNLIAMTDISKKKQRGRPPGAKKLLTSDQEEDIKKKIVAKQPWLETDSGVLNAALLSTFIESEMQVEIGLRSASKLIEKWTDYLKSENVPLSKKGRPAHTKPDLLFQAVVKELSVLTQLPNTKLFDILKKNTCFNSDSIEKTSSPSWLKNKPKVDRSHETQSKHILNLCQVNLRLTPITLQTKKKNEAFLLLWGYDKETKFVHCQWLDISDVRENGNLVNVSTDGNVTEYTVDEFVVVYFLADFFDRLVLPVRRIQLTQNLLSNKNSTRSLKRSLRNLLEISPAIAPINLSIDPKPILNKSFCLTQGFIAPVRLRKRIERCIIEHNTTVASPLIHKLKTDVKLILDEPTTRRKILQGKKKKPSLDDLLREHYQDVGKFANKPPKILKLRDKHDEISELKRDLIEGVI